MGTVRTESEKRGNRRTAAKVKPYGSVWYRTVPYGTEEEPETEPETETEPE